MPPDIIKQQQEVARKAMKRIETEVEYEATQWNNMLVWEAVDYDRVQAIIEDAIAQAIANIGRELEARCEGEKKVPALGRQRNGKIVDFTNKYDQGHNAALDRTLTIIRSITGISPTR